MRYVSNGPAFAHPPRQASGAGNVGISSGRDANCSGDIAGPHCASEVAHQPADTKKETGEFIGGYVHIDQSHVLKHGVAGTSVTKQPYRGNVSGIDGQIGNGMPVAIKGCDVAINGRPAGIIVAGSYTAAAVGVKVQVGIQFIADARAGVGISVGGVGAAVGLRAAGKCGSVGGRVSGGHLAGAVQVIADGVQLVQVFNFNEPVAVAVIVGDIDIYLMVALGQR